MKRNLYSKLHFAIENYFEYEVKLTSLGHKKNIKPVFRGDRVLRNKYYSMAHTFSNFLKREKRLNRIEDVRSEFVEEFLITCPKPDWRKRVRRRYLDFFITLPILIRTTYNIEIKTISKRLSDYITRQKDLIDKKCTLLEINSLLLNCKNNIRFNLLICYLTGVSYPGVYRLTPESIDLKRKQVLIFEYPGWKRFYPIPEFALPAWTELKAFCEQNNWQNLINNISQESQTSQMKHYLKKSSSNYIDNFLVKNWSTKIYVQRAFEEGLKQEKPISLIIEELIKEVGFSYYRYEREVYYFYEHAIFLDKNRTHFGS